MQKLNWFIIIEAFLFLFSFYFINLTLPLFKKFKCIQLVRDDGPKSHLYKRNTPTMGGVYFLLFMSLYVVIAYLFQPKALSDGHLFSLYALFMLFGLLGFIDDLCKLVLKDGLAMPPKILFQIIISLAWSICFLYKQTTISFPHLLEIKLNAIQAIFWGSFVIVATVNAINFTDGLDGLMTQTVLIVLIGFITIAYALDQPTGLLYTGVFGCMILLMIYPFNIFPAKIFIGDTGSMSIGAMVAGLALVQNIEIPFILMGIIFVLETLSVAIQIISYKCFKKRVFKMAPIHHSFELSGWHEQEVVRLFSIITLLGTFLAVWWVLG